MSASINLNALAAGTIYDVSAYVIGGCGLGDQYATFTTSNAPTNSLVGWVYPFAANAFEVNQAGPAALSGASVWVQAACALYPPKWINFPGTTTNFLGWYSLSFPMSVTIGLNNYSLSSSGACTANGVNPIPNTHYNLYAEEYGYWNETRWVSSTLSSSNDYQPFVDLAINPYTFSDVPLGLAWVHSSYAQCGFYVYNGQSSESVGQLVTPISGSGTTQVTSAGSWSNGLTNWGYNNAENPIYPFSGIVNETSGQILNTYTVGGSNQNVNTIPYWSSDWLSQPAGLPSPIPTGYHYAVLNHGYNSTTAFRQFGTFTQGTYSSWTSYGVNIGVSVGTGFGVNTPLVQLGWSDTVTTTSLTSSYCNVYAPIDPNGGLGYGYFYWYNVDSGSLSMITHVWFEGYCAYPAGSAGKEPTCPGPPA